MSFLILLEQHCTGQNSMKCCPRGSRQLCIRKNLVQCYLNTLRTTFQRSKPYAMLSERLQATLHKKILCNVVLILLRQQCTGKTLCNVVLEALSNNIVQEKIKAMSSEQHLVTLFTRGLTGCWVEC